MREIRRFGMKKENPVNIRETEPLVYVRKCLIYWVSPGKRKIILFIKNIRRKNTRIQKNTRKKNLLSSHFYEQIVMKTIFCFVLRGNNYNHV